MNNNSTVLKKTIVFIVMTLSIIASCSTSSEGMSVKRYLPLTGTEQLAFTPTATFAVQPTQDIKEYFIQVAQQQLIFLGNNRYSFWGKEFSLPDAWNLRRSQFIFNSTSGRNTFLVDRDPITKGDGQKLVARMSIIFPGPISESAEEAHQTFKIIGCWCCGGEEEPMPNKLLATPSAVGYICETTNYVAYAVFENYFLYEMFAPIEIFPEIESEFDNFFMSFSYTLKE